MKIRCVANSGDALPDRLIDAQSGFKRTTQFHVTVGSEYVVYGVVIFKSDIWYYICDDSYSYYPVWNPAVLFTITDDRVSRFWRVGYRPDHKSSDEVFIMAFTEWVSERYFYDRLTNGDPVAVDLFRRYKQLMDGEFQPSQFEMDAYETEGDGLRSREA